MIVDLGIGLIHLIQFGLLLSEFGFVGFAVLQWLAPIFGYKQPQVHVFKDLFVQFYFWLLGPVEREMGTVSKSMRKNQLLMITTMGIVIALFAIALEIWGMIAMTGMTFASYKLFGITSNLLTLYQGVIACVTLLAMALMTKASERAYHLPKYQ